MSDKNLDLNFAADMVEFESHTGYLGVPGDSIPEPVTAFYIDAFVDVRVQSAEIREGYCLRVVDEKSARSAPQDVMLVNDFMQVSRLAAAIHGCCGRPGEIVKVGYGFFGFHNALARCLDPTLPAGSVRMLGGTVRGRVDWGIEIEFSTLDANPAPVALLRGCLNARSVHGLASSMRDMAYWRQDALTAALEAMTASPDASQQPDGKAARSTGSVETASPRRVVGRTA